MGAQLAKTAATKTNDVAGDGTTTATILTQAIIAEGMRNVTAGANPLALRSGITQAADRVNELLTEWATPVAGDRAAIAQVGTIASRDELIGDLLGDALEKVGADGVVRVEEHSGADHRARVHRRRAVRQGLHLAVLRDRPGGRRGRPGERPRAAGAGEDLRAGRPAAAAGEGAREQEAAADRGRGRRGRGAVHPGGQRDPQDLHRRRGQVAVLRRPPQGLHPGPGDRHRRRGGLLRGRPQAGRGRARGAGQRPPGHRHQGRHHRSSTAAAPRRRSPSARRSCARTSRPPIPTGTGRSCRSGWPSWPAASR